jgi:hypothetical protein
LTIDRHIARRLLFALAFSLLLLAVATRSAHAEFEVQESTIEDHEVQLQYRGAAHSGLPTAGDEQPLDQSHELELQMSPTDHWLFAFTQGYEQPQFNALELTSIELESQVEIITLQGDGLGFAMQGGYEKTLGEEADQPSDYHAGPIIELAKGKVLLTTDLLFFNDVGANSGDQPGLGLEYSFQAAYNVTDRLALCLEAFGEIESLSNSGPFQQQEHYIGPAFYYTFGKLQEDAEEEEKQGIGNGKYGEFTVSFGLLFGLTQVTSDIAAKVFIGYVFN